MLNRQPSRRLSLVLALTALLTSTVLISEACAGKVTGATPIAQAAITADAIVIRINELQAAVIQACGPAMTCQAGSLSTALARDLVQTCIDVRVTVKAVPAGWQALVRTAWVQARPRFAAVSNPAIVAALAAVDLVLEAL